jgi:PTH1 family peptidyl-tRNA hydrolase
MTLFVGLGNPTPAYEKTRHNIGWRVIDRLVEKSSARSIGKSIFHGELYRHGELFFLKPLTYMNLSGKSVLPVMNFFKISIENIVVIHDDIDLPFGAVRIKRGGGNGGHNGLKSIDAAIGREYLRVRMGVGKPLFKSQVADYVLHPFSEEEESMMERWVEYVSRCCLDIPHESLDILKSRYTLKDIGSLQ